MTSSVPSPGAPTPSDRDELSRRMLTGLAARHALPIRLGCSLVAHRDLGFCSGCITDPPDAPWFATATELSGWRLLAMAERGIPDQPSREPSR